MKKSLFTIRQFTAILLLAGGTFISVSAQTTSYGTGAGTGGTEGSYFGANAGTSSTGIGNSFFGHHSGENNTLGISNTFLGQYSGRNNTTGFRNTFLGAVSGIGNTTGGYNVFVGYATGNESATGAYNTFLGSNAGASSVSGNFNTYTGYASFGNNKGSNNTAVGYRTGYHNISGQGNLFLGYQAGFNELGSNKLYIANSETATPLIYGEFDNSKLVFNGKVGIATSAFPDSVGGADITTYQLFVKGGILADEVRVASGWADYVFLKDYQLKTLRDVEAYIKKNGHLPNVPRGQEIENKGLNLGEITRIQQEKIEELTLYLIEHNKRLDACETKISELESDLKEKNTLILKLLKKSKKI